MPQAQQEALNSQVRSGVAWDNAVSMTLTSNPANMAQLPSLEIPSKHYGEHNKDLNGTGPVFNSDTLGSLWQKVLIRLSSYLFPKHLEVRQISPCKWIQALQKTFSTIYLNLCGDNRDLWGKMFAAALSMTAKNQIQQQRERLNKLEISRQWNIFGH